MNNSLERLVEGIIATMRRDVIPNVGDSYARGQAIGVIDLLNNIAPRLEWKRSTLTAAIAARTALVAEVRGQLGLSASGSSDRSVADDASASSADLLSERDRLDAEISDLVAHAFAPQAGAGAEQARRRLRQFMHEDAAIEMKTTRKPLFAEIAKGGKNE